MQTSAMRYRVCLAASIIGVFVVLVYNQLCGEEATQVPRSRFHADTEPGSATCAAVGAKRC
jgi:hypothetical protein